MIGAVGVLVFGKAAWVFGSGAAARLFGFGTAVWRVISMVEAGGDIIVAFVADIWSVSVVQAKSSMHIKPALADTPRRIG